MRELASIFVFWMIAVSPKAVNFGGEIYYYPNKESCEAALELNVEANSHIQGLTIAPSCIEILVPPLEESEPENEGLPI